MCMTTWWCTGQREIERVFVTHLVQCHKTIHRSFWDKELVWDLHRARLVKNKEINEMKLE